MAEDKNFLMSQEGIQKFNRTVSELKKLPGLQLEILEKVLEKEEEIGKVKIGYLNDFFSAYEQKLQTIANKQSQLDETYLILNKRIEKFETNTSSGGQASGNSTSSSSSNGGSGSSDGGGGNNNGRPPSGAANVSNTARSELDEIELSGLTEEQIKKGEERRAASMSRLDELAKFYQLNEEERENEILKFRADKKKDDASALDSFEEALLAKRTNLYKNFDQQRRSAEQSLIELHNLKHEEQIDQENRVTAIRLKRTQDVLDAEISAQNLLNDLSAELNYYSKSSEEAGELRSREATAQDTEKSAKELDEKRLKWIAKQELESKRKNGGVLEKEESARILREAAAKFKADKANLDKLTKLRQYEQAKEQRDKEKAEKRQAQSKGDELLGVLTGKGQTLKDRIDAFKDLTTNAETGKTDFKAVGAVITKALSNFAQKLEDKIDSIASYKSDIDTRLQGSSLKMYSGSYWDQLTKDMMGVGAINPYFKQEDFAKNIKSLVDEGIAFDLEQRAFLMTVQSKIASTFEVADGTLLRLIRIQQEDSTAGRLGMESALNSFLNNMYENTEYLKTVADSVRGSLEEMQSLMSGAEATEVEYQVQKWLGSLYSVGMSQNAVNSISTALGQIAAGQIEGLTSGGAGNLLIMAANDAGIPIADILTRGITSEETNKLLQAAVNYLAEMSESAKDNKVVQQQLADVFGVKASDLKAATNLALPGSTSSIYNNSMTYNNMLYQLSEMAGSMGSRTSLGEMMSNIWENANYTMASGIASSPVSYFIYKTAGLLDDTVGGIPFPDISIMGNTVALNTTIADIMRVAALGGGIISSFGSLVSGLGNSFSGQKMLNQLGIKSGSGLTITPRGDGSLLKMTGDGSSTVSESGYVGNASGSDIKNSTIQETKDSNKKQMIEAKEEEEANQVNVLNTTVLKIYELLDDVAHGSGYFKVKVENYGLTKGASGAQAGVAALGNRNDSSGLVDSGGSASGGGNFSNSVSLGGWTTA